MPEDLVQTVRVERSGRVARLTIDRPPLNVLDIPTLEQLAGAVASLDRADDDLQVVVLRGAGDRAFSAGVSVQDHTPDKVGPMLETFHRAIRRLRDLQAVTVAAVQGHCLGGGMELAMACDLVVAADNARFGQPEVELGCYPPAAAALYPALLGAGRTLDLLLTGRLFDSREAERLGLLTRLCPTAELDGEVDTLVAAITAKSAPVTRLIKSAVRAGRDRGFTAGLAEAERLYLDDLTRTEDMQEGLGAFLEKRKPAWKHR